MLRNIMITGTAICLSMGSSLARADHDRQLRYVVGGALLGAALGELVYVTNHRGYLDVNYGYGYGPSYGYGHGYAYRPGIVYAPPRSFAPRSYYRSWDHDFRRGHHRPGGISHGARDGAESSLAPDQGRQKCQRKQPGSESHR